MQNLAYTTTEYSTECTRLYNAHIQYTHSTAPSYTHTTCGQKYLDKKKIGMPFFPTHPHIICTHYYFWLTLMSNPSQTFYTLLPMWSAHVRLTHHANFLLLLGQNGFQQLLLLTRVKRLLLLLKHSPVCVQLYVMPCTCMTNMALSTTLLKVAGLRRQLLLKMQGL